MWFFEYILQFYILHSVSPSPINTFQWHHLYSLLCLVILPPLKWDGCPQWPQIQINSWFILPFQLETMMTQVLNNVCSYFVNYKYFNSGTKSLLQYNMNGRLLWTPSYRHTRSLNTFQCGKIIFLEYCDHEYFLWLIRRLTSHVLKRFYVFVLFSFS